MATMEQLEQFKAALAGMSSGHIRSLASAAQVERSFYKPGAGTRYLKTETLIERITAKFATLEGEAADKLLDVAWHGTPVPPAPVTEPGDEPEPAEPDEPSVENKIEAAIRDMMSGLLKNFKVGVDENKVRDIVKRELSRIGPMEHVIKCEGQPDRKIDGVVHEKFDTVLRKAKAGVPILLVGPAGTGKTHLAGQVAAALGREFVFNSYSIGMSEGTLGGKLLPTGENGRFEYAASQFVDAYETGKVYLGDEFDSADGNTLTFINAALANGHMSIPNRLGNAVAKRHPDFVFIAAANTFGLGADRQYVGRQQLDAATLNRVQMGTVEVDYDTKLEERLIPKHIVEWGWAVRKSIYEHGIRRILSTRDMLNAAKCEAAGEMQNDWKKSYFSGWKKDELEKIEFTLRPQ